MKSIFTRPLQNVNKSERADTRYAHPKCETMKMTLIDSLHDRTKERVLKIVQDEYLHPLLTDFQGPHTLNLDQANSTQWTLASAISCRLHHFSGLCFMERLVSRST